MWKPRQSLENGKKDAVINQRKRRIICSDYMVKDSATRLPGPLTARLMITRHHSYRNSMNSVSGGYIVNWKVGFHSIQSDPFGRDTFSKAGLQWGKLGSVRATGLLPGSCHTNHSREARQDVNIIKEDIAIELHEHVANRVTRSETTSIHEEDTFSFRSFLESKRPSHAAKSRTGIEKKHKY